MQFLSAPQKRRGIACTARVAAQAHDSSHSPQHAVWQAFQARARTGHIVTGELVAANDMTHGEVSCRKYDTAGCRQANRAEHDSIGYLGGARRLHGQHVRA